MNYVFFIIKSALEDFRRNKVRTMLTSLGILIGVASVVLLTAFGLGLKKYISEQFESLGTNLLIVAPGKILQNGQFRGGSGGGFAGIRFDEKDYNSLKKTEGASYVVPVFVKSAAEVSANSNTESSDVYGTTSDIFAIRNLDPQNGRVFEKTDVDKRAKVAVIGPKLAGKLFSDAASAEGRNVIVDNQNFKIIGVLKSKGGGGFGGPDFDSFVYVPYKSLASFNTDKKFFAFYIKAQSDKSISTAKKSITTILDRRYKIDDFSVIEQTEILNAVSSIFGIINTVLVSIAAISLIVGGIGIMNIMYVSVIERVREIGIRRAIGATRRDILSQFLAESIILSLFGGFLGLSLSFLVVLGVQQFFPAYIDLPSVILAVGVSSIIGIVFGVFPARKAAALSPIEAIRYE